LVVVVGIAAAFVLAMYVVVWILWRRKVFIRV